MNYDIRYVEKPSEWAAEPKYMSFSALKNIESCPLRWALIHGHYANLWSGKGYPTKSSTPAIVGQVIHGAVEAVLKGAKKSTKGTLWTRMVETLRRYGGLTALIDSVLSNVFNEYFDNPRMTALVNQYQHGQFVLPPTVRTSIQSLLRKIPEETAGAAETSVTTVSQNRCADKVLPDGLYTEITLYAANVNWYGKVDLLNIDENEITIGDIKTGKAKDADHEQILIYAWLWWRDTQRNPKGRLPTRLRIQYLGYSVNIPVLDETEWYMFEEELIRRTSNAAASIAKESCEARPDADICGYCEVRQLCDVYWRDVVSNEPTDVGRYGDVEAELIAVISPKTWQIRVNAGSSFSAGATVLLRGTLPEQPTEAGSKIRILDAMFIHPSVERPSDETPTIQLLAHSEIFIRPPISAAH